MEDPRVLAAIIGAVSSIITVLVFKPFIDKKLLKYKLEQEFDYQQRKQIKETISYFKAKLLHSAELLSNRLANFGKKHEEVAMEFLSRAETSENYYYDSSVYRILSFIGWMKIINEELIFLVLSRI